jgi:hypothetical protein
MLSFRSAEMVRISWEVSPPMALSTSFATLLSSIPTCRLQSKHLRLHLFHPLRPLEATSVTLRLAAQLEVLQMWALAEVASGHARIQLRLRKPRRRTMLEGTVIY